MDAFPRASYESINDIDTNCHSDIRHFGNRPIEYFWPHPAHTRYSRPGIASDTGLGTPKKVDTAWQWCIIGSLMVTLVSALPLGAVFVGYGIATAIALALRRRIWQIPLLAMFIVTFLGTVILNGVSLLALWLTGNPVPVLESLNLITLPGILLNLLLAIPAYGLLHELAGWLYPEELEV